ncbi:hypothetical protein EV426DRAFT_578944, partial [Tirmania nivea]
MSNYFIQTDISIVTDKSPSSGVVPLTTGLQDEYLVQLTINKSPSSSVAAPPAATPSDSLQSNEDTSDSMIVPPTYEPNPDTSDSMIVPLTYEPNPVMYIAIGLFDTPAAAASTAAPAAIPSDSLQSNEDTFSSMIVPPTYNPNPAIALFDIPAVAPATSSSLEEDFPSTIQVLSTYEVIKDRQRYMNLISSGLRPSPILTIKVVNDVSLTSQSIYIKRNVAEDIQFTKRGYKSEVRASYSGLLAWLILSFIELLQYASKHSVDIINLMKNIKDKEEVKDLLYPYRLTSLHNLNASSLNGNILSLSTSINSSNDIDGVLSMNKDINLTAVGQDQEMEVVDSGNNSQTHLREDRNIVDNSQADRLQDSTFAVVISKKQNNLLSPLFSKAQLQKNKSKLIEILLVKNDDVSQDDDIEDEQDEDDTSNEDDNMEGDDEDNEDEDKDVEDVENIQDSNLNHDKRHVYYNRDE